MNNDSDLCVECAKNGVVSKVQTLYIDFEETIRLCENKMCLHPFGLTLTTRSSVASEEMCINNALTNENESMESAYVHEKLDFDIDRILDAPVNVDDNLSDLLSFLDSGTCKLSACEEPPKELAYLNNLEPVKSTGALTATESADRLTEIVSMQIETNLKAVSKANGVTQCKKVTKEPAIKIPTVNNKSCSLTSSSNSIKPPNQRFPCFKQSQVGQKTGNMNGALKKTAVRKRQTQPSAKNEPKLKRIPQNDIFSFADSIISSKKKYNKQLTKASDTSSNQCVSGGADHSLVRQWLAKQSPGRAFPGYGVTASKSLQGTSDGRSATDSVPPSPASLF